MFTKLLVPTDGSEAAERAVVVAGDLASTHGAEVVLLHVISGYDVPPALAHFAKVEGIPEAKTSQHVEPFLAGPPHVVVTRPAGARRHIERHAVMHTVAGNILEAAKGIAAQHGAATVRSVTAEGDPAGRILEIAHEEGVDGIVLGSRGLSGLKGALVGSVSHKVCHDAGCTCIAVT